MNLNTRMILQQILVYDFITLLVGSQSKDTINVSTVLKDVRFCHYS